MKVKLTKNLKKDFIRSQLLLRKNYVQYCEIDSSPILRTRKLIPIQVKREIK